MLKNYRTFPRIFTRCSLETTHQISHVSRCTPISGRSPDFTGYFPPRFHALYSPLSPVAIGLQPLCSRYVRGKVKHAYGARKRGPSLGARDVVAFFFKSRPPVASITRGVCIGVPVGVPGILFQGERKRSPHGRRASVYRNSRSSSAAPRLYLSFQSIKLKRYYTFDAD